jgi:preprotein translocase subunit SecA
MVFKQISKLFDTNERELKKIRPIIEKVNQLESEFENIKDKDIKAKTQELKLRLEKGETLDDVLPEAFALVREASKRTLGLRHYDVQLIAAVALHQGMVAEQKTGEGKTLSATAALYLNSLTGKGAHLITVNDYLAQRDAGWNAPLFYMLGVSVGVIIHDQAYIYDPKFQGPDRGDERLEHLKPVERKEAYQADVTYGMSSEFGFDYLRDNMTQSKDQQVGRGFHFSIVDEVDSILIDEARTPLIISAPDTEPTDKYFKFRDLIDGLVKNQDYEVDEKLRSVTLTDYGVKRIEKMLDVDNLYEKDYDALHHIEQALKAKTLFNRDKEYVVKDGQVVIVDEHTGRLMPGRRYSDGLHQAIEAKEGVNIQRESITMATVSIQNYFRMYQKLSGMTGTAATEAEEFKKIYDVDVLVVPTNRPIARKDHADVVYKTTRAKYGAIVKEVAEKFKKGQPVLLGTRSIEHNEIIHTYLKRKKIPHQVLNAKNHEGEAQIIADAGRPNAVTVATNIAGRGVDIVLGGAPPEDKNDKKALEIWQKNHDKVKELGGLHVIGTERHESRRIDNQLRGRSGRQGDPGSSRFYVALDDEIMRIFGGAQVAKLMDALKIPEDQPIEAGMVSRSIAQAQSKVEGFHFDQRKHLVEYDDVLNKQREIVYKRRQKLLEIDPKDDSKKLHQRIEEILNSEIELLVNARTAEGITEDEAKAITKEFASLIPLDKESFSKLESDLTKSTEPEYMISKLKKLFKKTQKAKIEEMGDDQFASIEKFILLKTLDELWVDHLDAIEDLRQGIWMRGSQEQAISEYKKEAFDLFEKLINTTNAQVARRVFRLQLVKQPQPTINIQQAEAKHEEEPASPTPDVKETIQKTDNNPFAKALAKTAAAPVKKNTGIKKKKIGRNDPCPCGSGKKWKKCHYPEIPA